MNKKEIISNIINSYLKNDLPTYYSRNKEFQFLSKVRKIYTIIWPRRTGKTYFLYQIIDNLLKTWVKKENTLYFFLERDDIFPIELKDLNVILETYFEIVWYDKSKKYYIFFDEIQEIKLWEKFATKIYNEFKNVELVLTWSSSKLLSKEIYTWLRWKSISESIFPLSIKEAYSFLWFDLKNISLEEKFNINKFFKEFLNYWFFPEIVLEKEIYNKIKILDEYFDLIFYKDIVERNNFRNFTKLRKFRKIISSYITNFISISNISTLVWVSESVVNNWLEAFKDAYLLFELKNFDFSIWKMENSKSKIYLVDNWFYYLNFWDFKQDYWILFENFVFMEFKKLWFEENKNLFYFKNKEFDIDFLVFKDNKPVFIQVVYELNNDNFEREVKQLEKTKEKYDGEVCVIYYENKLDFELENVNLVKFYEIGKI